MYEPCQQVRREHVDGEDVLEAVGGFDPAFSIADADVVDHCIERAQPVRLIGNAAGFGDARHVADHYARGCGCCHLRILRTLCVAGVQHHLVACGQQSLRGGEAQAIRRARDENLGYGYGLNDETGEET